MTNERKLELTLCGMLPYDLQILDLYGDIKFCNLYNFEIYDLKKVKPLLHSLDKLTEPILEGGLIPMDEFRKIAPFTDSNDELAKDIIDMFKEDLIMVPFWVIKKLKEWHFNIYDLPSDMYIEKSSVK